VKELLEEAWMCNNALLSTALPLKGDPSSVAAQAPLGRQDDSGVVNHSSATAVADARSGHCNSYCLKGNVRPPAGGWQRNVLKDPVILNEANA